MKNLQDFIQQELTKIQSQNRYRSLKEPLGFDFSSNDYLGLSQHSTIKEKLIEGIQIYGGGSSASRLIRGHRKVFEETEEIFAHFVQAEASLFLANGFLANLGLLDLLGKFPVKFFCDRLNHASILDGIRLSGAEVRYFKHLDYENLENLLKKEDPNVLKVIVSETIFSMDGDKADVKKLIELKQKYTSVLVLDEAHALGIFGKNGGGVALEESEETNQIDFRIYTCGKSLGLEGAFIACKKEYKEFLINAMRTFIFSTAPMPAIVYALRYAIKLVKDMDIERKRILELSNILRTELKVLGFNTLNSCSQIIPVIINDEKQVMEYAARLQEKNLDVRGIRPPSVKESRLRISLNVHSNLEHLEKVVQVLKELKLTTS
ncbi:MAG: 8-amino-7-oxononanoate synthase [Leptospiraceae bacterium]|nr:8-amino-7-oxononanoate synthase [Leptospiraceae bacterium]